MESLIFTILEFFLIFPAAFVRYLFSRRKGKTFKDFLKKEDWLLNSTISLMVIAAIVGAFYTFALKK